MNTREQTDDLDPQRAYRLLDVIEQDEGLSQRELATRLGVAVGLINSYLKNLAAKGFIRIKNFPRNRYAYLLTPKGFAEKSRLAYQHLQYFNGVYQVARADFRHLFQEIRNGGGEKVVFCGIDEVAEIAYLSLQEAGLQLAGVFDTQSGKQFFGQTVRPIEEVGDDAGAVVTITTFKRKDEIERAVKSQGIEPRMCETMRSQDLK